jgi:hypothetical protein
MKAALRVLCTALSLLAWSAGLAAPASVADTLAKARNYLGGDKALDAISSLRYVGRMELRDPSVTPPKLESGTIELVFQKPGQQRLTQVVDQTKDIIGLSGDEAWRRREELNNPVKAQVAIMNLRTLRRIQAEAYENLSFYRGAEAHGARVELRGETGFEGREAVQIAFIYPGNVVFVRTFDKKTGALLLTETYDGSKVREEGEIIVEGVRFPRRLISTAKNPSGVEVTHTLVFDQIVVNEKFDPSVFSVQLPGAK